MSNAPSPPAERKSACPLCDKPASGRHGPFCGQGCRDRDLLNWLGESYRAPGPPSDDHSGLDSDG